MLKKGPQGIHSKSASNSGSSNGTWLTKAAVDTLALDADWWLVFLSPQQKKIMFPYQRNTTPSGVYTYI